MQANQWVKEEIRKKTLIERLHTLIHESDAALALPGGAGTLTEISLMWNLMIVESLHRRPLILIGDGWQSTFDQFFRGARLLHAPHINARFCISRKMCKLL